MKLSTIEISPEEAAARLADYEAAVKDERTVEDEAIAAGYRAAKRGLPVISLKATFEAGGFHDNGLPRLAIVRATANECWVRPDSQRLLFESDQWARQRGALVGRDHVRVDVGRPPRPEGVTQWAWNGHTIVPLIPPQIRPGRYRLHLFHILWEVEEWTPVPPRDPALLRHIRGDLWAVHAVWDLTELERAVLGQRAST